MASWNCLKERACGHMPDGYLNHGELFSSPIRHRSSKPQQCPFSPLTLSIDPISMAYPNDNTNRYPPTHAADDCDVHMDIETLGTYAYDILGNRLGVIERRGGTATNPDCYCKHETHRLVDCHLTYGL